jgi:exodeoxyribonuclease VII large subunit
MDFTPPFIYTVSALTAEITDSLESSFGEIWVEGEISNFRMPPSGHLYFTLKDESSQIQAVTFRSRARSLRFEPEDGLRVICHGRVSVYAKRGQYQLILEYMEPRGVGALQLAFEQLKRRLEREGLFDPLRKKTLPMLPHQIGIVTSPVGAVIRDMLTILEGRYENIGVLLYPVKVQGEGAAEEIAAGVAFLDRHSDADVIILARGGGALEDLWAFNEEVVARAVAEADKPIVSAVGHEVDFTICDFVADVRAATPSAAGELVVPTKKDVFNRITALRDRLSREVGTVLARRRDRSASLASRLRDPRRGLANFRMRIDDLATRFTIGSQRIFQAKRTRLDSAERNLLYRTPFATLQRLRDDLHLRGEGLDRAMRGFLGIKRRGLERAMDRLQAMSPLNILRRGYSIVRKIPSMDIVRDAGSVKPQDRVDVRLDQGELICRVEETKLDKG